MSNLFDLIHSVHNEETTGDMLPAVHPSSRSDRPVETYTSKGQITHSEMDPEPAEDVLDINAFRTKFTIPKKKSQHRHIFETIGIDSRQFQHDIDPILRQSFKDRSAENCFVYTRCQLVHSEPLIKEYTEKRKQFKRENYSDKETQETYVFISCDTESEARLFCTEGIKVNNSNITCLGNPELGVYMSKHADLVSPSSYRPGQFGRLVIFKAMKGKVKSMVEKRSGTPLDPTPNYDCHVSKMASVDLSSTSPQYAFESNQVYFYEYDDCFEIVQRPRQLVPHALIHFRYHHSESLKKLRLPPQLTPVNINKQSPGSQPTRNTTPTRRSSQPPALSKRPALLPTPTTMSSSASSLMTTPSPPALSKSRSMEKTPPLPVIKTKVGKEVENGQGVIIWTGQLANGDINLCTIDMLAYGTAIKPALFGQRLTISKMLPWTTVMTVLFNNLVTLPRNTETIAAGRYFSYYKIVPASGEEDILRTIIVYFQQKESAGYVDLEQVKGILLPNCQITHNLGLSSPTDSGDILHCVFISSQSRQQLLKGRISIPNGSGSMANGGFSAYSIATSIAATSSAAASGSSSPNTSPTVPHDQQSQGLVATVGDQGTINISPLLTGSSHLFRDPPTPRRVASLSLHFPDPDFFYEGGFKTVPPSTCHIAYKVLFREFVEQMTMQDKRNIDVARGKYRARVTITQAPKLPVSPVKGGFNVEPKVASTLVWGQKGNIDANRNSSLSKIPEALPAAAAPHRDPRVQKRKKQGVSLPTTPNRTSVSNQELSSDVQSSPMTKDAVKSLSHKDFMDILRSTNVSQSEVKKTDSTISSVDTVMTDFGTAQTFDFNPETASTTAATVSSLVSDVFTKLSSSLVNDVFSKVSSSTECKDNISQDTDDKVSSSTDLNSIRKETDADNLLNQTVAQESKSPLKVISLLSEETKSKSGVPLDILEMTKEVVASDNPSLTSNIRKVTKSIISLPLPPGEEINEDDIIIDKPGKISSDGFPEQFSLPHKKELYREDGDFDNDLSDDIINQIVKKAPLAAKKAREVGSSTVLEKDSDTLLETTEEKEIEPTEISRPQKTDGPEANTLTVTADAQNMLSKSNDGGATGLPDWVLNPSLLESHSPNSQSQKTEITYSPTFAVKDASSINPLQNDRNEKIVQGYSVTRNISETKNDTNVRKHSDQSPERQVGHHIACTPTRSSVHSLLTNGKATNIPHRSKLNAKYSKVSISPLMFKSKQIYKKALKVKAKKKCSVGETPLQMLQKLQRQMKKRKISKSNKVADICRSVKAETIWVCDLKSEVNFSDEVMSKPFRRSSMKESAAENNHETYEMNKSDCSITPQSNTQTEPCDILPTTDMDYLGLAQLCSDNKQKKLPPLFENCLKDQAHNFEKDSLNNFVPDVDSDLIPTEVTMKESIIGNTDETPPDDNAVMGNSCSQLALSDFEGLSWSSGSDQSQMSNDVIALNKSVQDIQAEIIQNISSMIVGPDGGASFATAKQVKDLSITPNEKAMLADTEARYFQFDKPIEVGNDSVDFTTFNIEPQTIVLDTSSSETEALPVILGQVCHNAVNSLSMNEDVMNDGFCESISVDLVKEQHDKKGNVKLQKTNSPKVSIPQMTFSDCKDHYAFIDENNCIQSLEFSPNDCIKERKVIEVIESKQSDERPQSPVVSISTEDTKDLKLSFKSILSPNRGDKCSNDNALTLETNIDDGNIYEEFVDYTREEFPISENKVAITKFSEYEDIEQRENNCILSEGKTNQSHEYICEPDQQNISFIDDKIAIVSFPISSGIQPFSNAKQCRKTTLPLLTSNSKRKRKTASSKKIISTMKRIQLAKTVALISSDDEEALKPHEKCRQKKVKSENKKKYKKHQIKKKLNINNFKLAESKKFKRIRNTSLFTSEEEESDIGAKLNKDIKSEAGNEITKEALMDVLNTDDNLPSEKDVCKELRSTINEDTKLFSACEPIMTNQLHESLTSKSIVLISSDNASGEFIGIKQELEQAKQSQKNQNETIGGVDSLKENLNENYSISNVVENKDKQSHISSANEENKQSVNTVEKDHQSVMKKSIGNSTIGITSGAMEPLITNATHNSLNMNIQNPSTKTTKCIKPKDKPSAKNMYKESDFFALELDKSSKINKVKDKQKSKEKLYHYNINKKCVLQGKLKVKTRETSNTYSTSSQIDDSKGNDSIYSDEGDSGTQINSKNAFFLEKTNQRDNSNKSDLFDFQKLNLKPSQLLCCVMLEHFNSQLLSPQGTVSAATFLNRQTQTETDKDLACNNSNCKILEENSSKKFEQIDNFKHTNVENEKKRKLSKETEIHKEIYRQKSKDNEMHKEKFRETSSDSERHKENNSEKSKVREMHKEKCLLKGKDSEEHHENREKCKHKQFQKEKHKKKSKDIEMKTDGEIRDADFEKVKPLEKSNHRQVLIENHGEVLNEENNRERSKENKLQKESEKDAKQRLHTDKQKAIVKAALAKIAKRQYEDNISDEPVVKRLKYSEKNPGICQVPLIEQRENCKVSQMKRIPKINKFIIKDYLGSGANSLPSHSDCYKSNRPCVTSSCPLIVSDYNSTVLSTEQNHNSSNKNLSPNLKKDENSDNKMINIDKDNIDMTLENVNSEKESYVKHLIQCNADLKLLKAKLINYLKGKYVEKYGRHVEIITSNDCSISPNPYKGDINKDDLAEDLKRGSRTWPENEEVLQESVLSALHCNKKDSAATETSSKKEKDFVEFWSLALHYLLPIRYLIDAQIRELSEEEAAADADKVKFNILNLSNSVGVSLENLPVYVNNICCENDSKGYGSLRKVKIIKKGKNCKNRTEKVDGNYACAHIKNESDENSIEKKDLEELGKIAKTCSSEIEHVSCDTRKETSKFTRLDPSVEKKKYEGNPLPKKINEEVKTPVSWADDNNEDSFSEVEWTVLSSYTAVDDEDSGICNTRVQNNTDTVFARKTRGSFWINEVRRSYLDVTHNKILYLDGNTDLSSSDKEELELLGVCLNKSASESFENVIAGKTEVDGITLDDVYDKNPLSTNERMFPEKDSVESQYSISSGLTIEKTDEILNSGRMSSLSHEGCCLNVMTGTNNCEENACQVGIPTNVKTIVIAPIYEDKIILSDNNQLSDDSVIVVSVESPQLCKKDITLPSDNNQLSDDSVIVVSDKSPQLCEKDITVLPDNYQLYDDSVIIVSDKSPQLCEKDITVLSDNNQLSDDSIIVVSDKSPQLCEKDITVLPDNNQLSDDRVIVVFDKSPQLCKKDITVILNNSDVNNNSPSENLCEINSRRSKGEFLKSCQNTKCCLKEDDTQFQKFMSDQSHRSNKQTQSWTDLESLDKGETASLGKPESIECKSNFDMATRRVISEGLTKIEEQRKHVFKDQLLKRLPEYGGQDCRNVMTNFDVIPECNVKQEQKMDSEKFVDVIATSDSKQEAERVIEEGEIIQSESERKSHKHHKKCKSHRHHKKKETSIKDLREITSMDCIKTEPRSDIKEEFEREERWKKRHHNKHRKRETAGKDLKDKIRTCGIKVEGRRYSEEDKSHRNKSKKERKNVQELREDISPHRNRKMIRRNEKENRLYSPDVIDLREKINNRRLCRRRMIPCLHDSLDAKKNESKGKQISRFHPYKKEVQIKALKAYRDYQQLPNMTEVNYKSKLDSFCSDVRNILGKPLHAADGRFLNYSFKRSTLADVDDAKRMGDQDERNEFKWSEKDIPEFKEKSKIVCEAEENFEEEETLETSVYAKEEEETEGKHASQEMKGSTESARSNREHKYSKRHSIQDKVRHSRDRESSSRAKYEDRRTTSLSRKRDGKESAGSRKESRDEIHTKFKDPPASPTNRCDSLHLKSSLPVSPCEVFTDDILGQRITISPPASPSDSFTEASEGIFDLNTGIEQYITEESNMTYYKKNVISRPGRGWPILEIVDIPKAVPDYRPSKEGNLPSLFEKQIVPSRDPRLSATLPANSVYNKPIEFEHVLMMDDPEEPDDIGEPDQIAEPDEIAEPDDIENQSFHSDDWCEKDTDGNVRQASSPLKVSKVHVNPKFFPKLLRSPSCDGIADDDWILAQQGVTPPERDDAQKVIADSMEKEVKDIKKKHAQKDKSPRIIPYDEDISKEPEHPTEKSKNESDIDLNKKKYKKSVSDSQIRSGQKNGSGRMRDRHKVDAVIKESLLSDIDKDENKKEQTCDLNGTIFPSRQYQLKPLSQYSLNAYKKENQNRKSVVDDLQFGFQKDMIAALEKVSKGQKTRYDLHYEHLNQLTLATQIESSMLPDYPGVKKFHLAALRDWQKAKPLDVLVSGRYSFPEIKHSVMKFSLKTEALAHKCREEFQLEIYKITKGSEYKPDMDAVFKKPASILEETSNQMFRQVNQYMNFLVANSKPRSGEEPRKHVPDSVLDVVKRDSDTKNVKEHSSTELRKDVHTKEPKAKNSNSSQPKEKSKSRGQESERKRHISKESKDDLYSPTRPTEHEDGYVSPEGKKRKPSKSDETDSSKRQKREDKKKEKSRKDSHERSRSRSKSKGKEKKKSKEKKHKKDKDKGKHRKKEDKEKVLKSKDKGNKKDEEPLVDPAHNRRRKDSENRKSESEKVVITTSPQKYDLFDYRKENASTERSPEKRKKSESKPVELVSYPVQYSALSDNKNEPENEEQVEFKSEEQNGNKKDLTQPDIPVAVVKPVPPKKDVQPPITLKQRDQAKDILKKTSEVFFKDADFLKVAKQLGLLPVAHSVFTDDSTLPNLGILHNAYGISWCVLQFFMDKDNVKSNSSACEGFDLTQFIIKEMDPENSFMWALLLALHEHITEEIKKRDLVMKDDLEDYQIELDKKNAESMKPGQDTTCYKADDEVPQNKSSKTGGNKLMMAFKQAQRLKKIQGQSGSKSTFAKLTPEQASKKPPKTPKTSIKSLFKPPIAYSLELTKAGHESNVEKEFYSIAEITKLNDLTLMDNLVRNAIEIFIGQTVDLLKVKSPDLSSEDMIKCLQPIILKSVSNIRNLLIIANNLLGMFKSKQGCDLFRYNQSKKKEAENKPNNTNVEQKGEMKVESEPEEGEITASSTPNSHQFCTDVNEYGSSIPVEVMGGNPGEAKPSRDLILGNYGPKHKSGKKESHQIKVEEPKQFVENIPVNEYGSSLLETNEGSINKAESKTDIQILLKNTDSVIKDSKSTELDDGEICGDDDDESTLKRQFRKRREKVTVDGDRSYSKVAKKDPLLSSSGLEFDSSGKMVEETDEMTENALKKLRKISSQPSSKVTLDKRIEAIIGEEKSEIHNNAQEENVVSVPGSEQTCESLDVMKGESSPKTTEDEVNHENAQIVERNTDTEEQSSVAEGENTETTEKKVPVVESVIAVKGKTPTVLKKNKLFQAFRQSKTFSKSSCTSSQKVTARDILAKLQEKTTPAPPKAVEGNSPVKEEIPEQIPMEIENVSSPIVDELDEELYQQALSKESESLDIQSPMEMSPVNPSSPLHDSTPVKSGAPVIYSKNGKPGQGIESLAKAVPNKESTTFNEKEPSDLQFDTPGTRLPAVVPSTSNPIDIPLPSSYSQDVMSTNTTSASGTYYAEPTVYTQNQSTADTVTSNVSKTATTYYSDQTRPPMHNPNQYSQYPPPPNTENIPAYDANQTGYPATHHAFPDPSQYRHYPGYDQYSHGYEGYYDNSSYNQGWDPYYGPQSGQDWNHSGWNQWGSQDNSQQSWGGWVPPPAAPPPVSYDQSGMPLPPPDFSLPPPGFPPKPSANPPLRPEGGKQPLLGPGGLLTNRMPPPPSAQTLSPQKKSDVQNKQIRFYVFNKERKLTEVVERFLLSVGGKVFDPFNLDTTLQVPGIDTMVFIQNGDHNRINEIPNLLQLRQEKKIQFAIYQDIQDIRAKRFQHVMEKGGTVLVDDSVLLGVIPESLENIMKFMTRQNEENIPWTFQVHNHSAEEITKVRCLKPTESKDYQRLTKVQEILDNYRETGLVNILTEHLCDSNLKPPQEYLQCALTQQSRNFQRYRHMLFLTNMPSNHVIARPFLDNGIEIINVVDFLKNVAGHQACPAQVAVQTQSLGQRDREIYNDIYQSSAIDRIETPAYDPIEIQIRYEEELAEIEELEVIKRKAERNDNNGVHGRLGYRQSQGGFNRGAMNRSDNY